MPRPPRNSLPFFLVLGLALHAAAAQTIHRPIISRVAPAYPELARRMHVAGIVEVEVTVRPDGTVSATKIRSGHALLSPAAETAVKQWHFAPAPEATNLVVDVEFTTGSD